jgi:hypothetical protein
MINTTKGTNMPDEIVTGSAPNNAMVIIQPKQELVNSSPAEMIQMAVSNGVDLDKLEKLMLLQEKWETNQAIKAYNKAMADFKANAPKIDKDRSVGYTSSKGKVGYNHASLGNVVEKISVELSKHGLSASWRTHQNGKDITVSCRISHEMGHYEETSLTAVADDSGAKNPIQAIGSTISYLQRYSILSLTGLATHDQDTDGVVEVEEKIDANKVGIINGLIKELDVDTSKFLSFMAVEKVEDIKATDFAKAKLMLEAKRKAKK